MTSKQALAEFVQFKVSTEMVQALAAKANSVISCQDDSMPMTPPTSPVRASFEASLPTLECFIATLCEKSRVQTPTLMSTMVYLDRLKNKLPPVAKGMPCTCHRVFLAALILSAKYLNDSSPKNKHWRSYTMGLFKLEEVNLMEKQLLFLLDWDLAITNENLYASLAAFLTPIKESILRTQQQTAMLEKRPTPSYVYARKFSSYATPPPSPCSIPAHATTLPSSHHHNVHALPTPPMMMPSLSSCSTATEPSPIDFDPVPRIAKRKSGIFERFFGHKDHEVPIKQIPATTLSTAQPRRISVASYL